MRCARERSRTQRTRIETTQRIADAPRIALKRPRVRQKVVSEQDGLTALQMGKAWHQDLTIRLRATAQR
jgi:hypothetical protein